MLWLTAAVLSSVFSGVVAILSKCGIKTTDYDLATAMRTTVIIIFSWLIVFMSGAYHSVFSLTSKQLIFLILSGFSTAASWLCYFKALSMGDVNKVVPVDKSSTIITVILAIIFFNETENLIVKLICTFFLAVGIYLMIEKKQSEKHQENKLWIIYAVLSAVFAALTSILAKIGIDGVDSNLANAIRAIVILIMAWIIVFAGKKQSKIKSVDKKEITYILLSGVATGISWMCYYYAIQNGVVSVVVPIDKASVAFAVLFSFIFLKEKLSVKSTIGLILMVGSTIAMALFA